MNLALAFDTETQGLPLFREPSEDPRQPHLVQLAAHLVDLDTRAIVQSMDCIIKPDGWTIPDDVAAVHGITTEYAAEVGVPEKLVLDMLLEMWSGRQRIAHNESFDSRLIRIAIKRFLGDDDLADRWKACEAHCTARLSTPIVDLPPTEKMVAAGRNHAKTPNLGEAYEFFMGKPLENAHRAIVDVNACLDIWWALQDRTTQQNAEAAVQEAL